MKNRPVGAELFHADEQTDRQTDRQTDIRKLIVSILRFCEKCLRIGFPAMCLLNTDSEC